MSTRWLKELRNWLRALGRRDAITHEVNLELEQHLEFMTADNIAKGMSPREAQRAALLKFGGVEKYTEECRDSWGTRLLQELSQDIRFGMRQLNKARGFSIVAILTLAVGIGAATAIFSIVNRVALQPLPYADSGRLVEILQVQPSDQREFAPNMETVEELQRQASFFASVAGSTGMHGNLTGVDYPVRIFGNAVSSDYFSTLGVPPLLGRTFLPEEAIEGKANVIVLNHAFWLSQFNGDESLVGRELILSDQAYTVIGVMPPGFRTLTGQMSSPKAFSPLKAPVSNSARYLREALGRLKPEVTIEQAQAEIDVLAQQLQASNPDLWRELKLRIVPLLDFHVGDTRPTLYMVLGAVGVLLLIACVNVANLLLARASARQREIALRSALGASRIRVVRQLLAESILLALIGGALGIALAYGSLDALLSFAPVDMPRLDEVRIDRFALLFSCGVTMLTGIGFGLVPALQGSKVDLNGTLKDGSRTVGDGRHRARLRNALVVAEVALALILLIGAGLLTRTYANLRNVEMGYDGEVVHGTRIMFLPEQYPDDQARVAFTDRALEQLALQPELVASAFTTGLPYFGAFRFRFDVEERSETDANRLPIVTLSTITPDYFKVLGTPFIRGRLFNDRDRENTPLVAIIGENVAKQHFPGQNPLGKRIALVDDDAPRVWRGIVGLVGDVRMDGAVQDPAPAVYVPFSQHPTLSHIKPVVRVREGSRNPGPIVAAALQKVDTGMPVERHMLSLGEFDGFKIAPQTFNLFLFGVFSAVALLLAALGIYGVMAYSVSQRTNEIGIRMALGALRGDILRLVLVHAARLVAIGLVIGIAGALAGTRLLGSLLYDISPNDPVTYVLVPCMLSLVAAFACWLPAHRATKVDPMVALRTD